MPLKRASNPFRFVTQANLVELTGVEAKDVLELADYLKGCSGAIVYHHTHHFLKQHQYLSPEPPNDFAYWVTTVLNEDKLGEQLAAIDTVKFPTISALQQKLVETLEKFVSSQKSFRSAPIGEEFHFMKSKSFVLPTPYEVFDLQEFFDVLEKVSTASLYHHMFEARMRLGRATNDFSLWLETELGEKEVAQAIKRLDPYTHTMEGLRQSIRAMIKNRLGCLRKDELLAP